MLPAFDAVFLGILQGQAPLISKLPQSQAELLKERPLCATQCCRHYFDTEQHHLKRGLGITRIFILLLDAIGRIEVALI